MTGYKLVVATLAMATGTLAAPTTAEHSCATADVPFVNAICHNVMKSDGTEAALFVSGHFTPGTTMGSHLLVHPRIDGYCDVENTIFSGKSANPDAPVIVDCSTIRLWLDRNPGAWSMTKDRAQKHTWAALAALDSCAVVAKSSDNLNSITIGSNDVADLINKSIVKHHISDKVDVFGRTNCGSEDLEIAVDWRITRPGTLDMGN